MYEWVKGVTSTPKHLFVNNYSLLVILFESFKLGNNNAKHTHIMYDNNSDLALTIITYSL